MSTDNPSESEVSIESRLSAVFGADEAELPEAAPVEAAPETDEEPTTEVAEEVIEDDSFDYETADGTVVKLPKAVEADLARQKDYTQKTMRLSAEKQMVDDQKMFLEAKAQIDAAVFEDAAQLRALESQLKQYKEADWSALFDANPGQALNFQRVMHDLEKQVNDKRQEIGGKARHISKALEEHQAKQWDMAQNAARQLIGNVSAAENAAMLQVIKSVGFEPENFKKRHADPGLIALTYKAAKWDSLQAGKSKAVQTANQAPPVVKPGASKGPAAASQQKYKDIRSSLKKSGSVDDAARLFLLRGM